jgi:Histidine kinase-like ATPase domain
VAEATMNAMEHGNRYRPEVPVVIEVLCSDADLSVRINDQGGIRDPAPDKEVPELEAKGECYAAGSCSGQSVLRSAPESGKSNSAQW